MSYKNEILNAITTQYNDKYPNNLGLDNITTGYLNMMKNGSKIHIKPENRGKFSKAAKAAGKSVQEYAKSVVNNPNSTTLQKRRAQFAINSKK